MSNSYGVDDAISKVPNNLKSDIGLRYDRLKWRSRRGRTESSLEIIDQAPLNKDDLVRSLIGSANLIGLLKHKSIDKTPKQKMTKEIKSLIKQREIARQNKDYQESDKLREILLGLGVEINDT